MSGLLASPENLDLEDYQVIRDQWDLLDFQDSMAQLVLQGDLEKMDFRDCLVRREIEGLTDVRDRKERRAMPEGRAFLE